MSSRKRIFQFAEHGFNPSNEKKIHSGDKRHLGKKQGRNLRGHWRSRGSLKGQIGRNGSWGSQGKYGGDGSMKRSTSLLLFLIFLASPAVHAGDLEKIDVQDLGTLGGKYSHALAINDLGQVVGVSATPTVIGRAFFWTAEGGMADLGPWEGFTARRWPLITWVM